MSYTSAERRFERHETRTGNTYYIGENGKRHYDHKPTPPENGMVTFIVCIFMCISFAVIAANIS